MERVLRHVQVNERGCWIWTGYRIRKGYGQLRVNGKNVLAHRYAYEQKHGPIPPRPDGSPTPLDHYVCDTPSCCNPDHVRPDSHRSNILRGNTVAAENAAKAECLNGHPFDEANTYVDPQGNRECRRCRTDRVARFRAKETV